MRTGVGVDVLRDTQRSPEFMSMERLTKDGEHFSRQSAMNTVGTSRCAQGSYRKAHGVGLEALRNFACDKSLLRQARLRSNALPIQHDIGEHICENGRTMAVSVLESRD
jgi:hypothetical protein